LYDLGGKREKLEREYDSEENINISSVNLFELCY